jgi:CoA:oxalate CoA-transferase
MTPLDKLAPILGLPAIAGLEASAAFIERDPLKRRIADHLAHEPTQHWLALLEPADIWCAEVLDWPALYASEGFKRLDMIQTVTRDDGVALRTTRSPIRVNGARNAIKIGAPRIGEHTKALRAEFGLGAKA